MEEKGTAKSNEDSEIKMLDCTLSKRNMKIK